MFTKKGYLFILVVTPLLLLIYSFFLFDRIDFFYIILLTFSTESVLITLYDMKFRIRYKEFNEEENKKLNYVSLIVTIHMFFLTIYVVYNKITLEHQGPITFGKFFETYKNLFFLIFGLDSV